MSRVMTLLIVPVAILGVSAMSGCTSLLTARTIQAFADGLEQGDLQTVKASTSVEFDQKALRLSESLDDLEILNVPTGKVSVVKTEEISETEKRVTVQVGERKKEVLYKLSRKPGGQWLVDDLYLKQKKAGDSEAITKSVTETMDLLLTVREFLSSWQTGDRSDVLAVTTPELRELLADLSPSHLQQLTTQVIGKSKRGSHRPEARIEEDRAVVMLPRMSGKLLIELNLSGDRWLVNDVAVESRDKQQQVRSTRRMAYILRMANNFLTAYELEDMAALEAASNEAFFRNSLSVGQLEDVPLPSQRLVASTYDVRVHDNQADLVVELPDATYMLTLTEREPGSYKQKIGTYEVSEVTIYNDNQVKRLSALLTAHAMLEVFSHALTTRDLSRLKQASTTRFNTTVWNLVDDELLNSLPMEEIEPASPRVVATKFQGAVTEITVTQGTRALTYVLRDSNGRMAVDDVLLPVVDRPKSLRQNLRTLIPVYGIARAFFTNDLSAARRQSSSELTRMLWEPLGRMPQLDVDVIQHLTSPVSRLSMTEDRADLLLGDSHRGTRITLTRSGDRFVVDNATFKTGSEPSQQMSLQRAGRLNLTAER